MEGVRAWFGRRLVLGGVIATGLVAAVLGAACGGGDESTEAESTAAAAATSETAAAATTGAAATTAAGSSDVTIGFINGGSFEFNTCLSDGLTAALEQGSAKVVEVNSNNDLATEVSNGEDLLAQGVSAIVLQTINIEAGSQVVEMAKAAGTPVFLTVFNFVQDPSSILGAVAMDSTKIGSLAGDYVKQQVDAAGEPAKVAIIEGAPGAASDVITAGFKQPLEGDQLIEVVFQQPGFWDRNQAAGVAENMIQAQPDLDYVFVANEDMAFGVLQSLKAAGKDDQIKIVTANGTDEGLEAVKNGEFVATVDASPYLAGAMSGDAVLGLLDGSSTEALQEVPLQLITADNVDQATPYCNP